MDTSTQQQVGTPTSAAAAIIITTTTTAGAAAVTGGASAAAAAAAAAVMTSSSSANKILYSAPASPVPSAATVTGAGSVTPPPVASAAASAQPAPRITLVSGAPALVPALVPAPAPASATATPRRATLATPTASATPTISRRQPTFNMRATATANHAYHPYHPTTTSTTTTSNININTANSTQAASGVAGVGAAVPLSPSRLSTPKKNLLDAVLLQTIREKLRTPGRSCEPQSTFQLESTAQPVSVIKERYLISTQPSPISLMAAAKTPPSYRHLIDLNTSSLRCTDIYTERQYLCKVVHEPLYKVQRAYFQLLHAEGDAVRSSLHGHQLIRGFHDIVPQSKQRTYIIVAPGTVYEDLHTYIRHKRRVGEEEARALFHQICETVQVCHRNGIILRDLKLKRFFFIDEARTQLQYESLEGSMILDDPNDDTLSDKIGCPLYTAPELLCPNPTYKGKPADMWSLGVILYTMLVGQYPFYEKVNCNLITIIRHCHVQIPCNLSRPVRWLLLLLLRKKHEERIHAEHILRTPWLRQQRPYYMSVPVDIEIPPTTDDATDCCGGRLVAAAAAAAMSSSSLSSSSSAMTSATSTTSTSSTSSTSTSPASSSPASSSSVGAMPEENMQPLDYTRSTLQMECDDDDSVAHNNAHNNGNNDNDNDNDNDNEAADDADADDEEEEEEEEDNENENENEDEDEDEANEDAEEHDVDDRNGGARQQVDDTADDDVDMG